MTEIQFLINLLLEHKLPESVKQKFIARIGEVESQMSKPVMNARLITPMAQAPSTQRILDDMSEGIIPPPQATKRIVGGEVNTGNGTKGPRKF